MAGLGKYFNSETFHGRANVAKATYASFALIYLYFRVKNGFKKSGEEPTLDAETSTAEEPQLPVCPCMPCQPICPPPPYSPSTPPAAEDPSKNLTEDPLFKQKISPKKYNSQYDDCDDEDYDEKPKSKTKSKPYDDECQ